MRWGVRPNRYIYIYSYIQFGTWLIPNTKTNTHPTLVININKLTLTWSVIQSTVKVTTIITNSKASAINNVNEFAQPVHTKWLTRCKLDSNFFTEKTRFTTFVASVFINNENFVLSSQQHPKDLLHICHTCHHNSWDIHRCRGAIKYVIVYELMMIMFTWIISYSSIWVLIVNTNGWGVACDSFNKQGVKCVDWPCKGEEIGRGKVKGRGMIGWQGKVGL